MSLSAIVAVVVLPLTLHEVARLRRQGDLECAWWFPLALVVLFALSLPLLITDAYIRFVERPYGGVFFATWITGAWRTLGVLLLAWWFYGRRRLCRLARVRLRSPDVPTGQFKLCMTTLTWLVVLDCASFLFQANMFRPFVVTSGVSSDGTLRAIVIALPSFRSASTKVVLEPNRILPVRARGLGSAWPGVPDEPDVFWSADGRIVSVWAQAKPLFAYDLGAKREMSVPGEAYKIPLPNPLGLADRPGRARALVQAGLPGDVLLRTAILEDDLPVVKALIEAGVSAGAPGRFGGRPMDWAVMETCKPGIVRYLLECGAGVNETDRYGVAPLYGAVAKGCVEVVRVLLEHGAAMDQPNSDGFSPLMIAAWHGHKDVVAVLLAHGADAGMKNKKGETALDVAKQRNHPEVVEVLSAQSGGQDP